MPDTADRVIRRLDELVDAKVKFRLGRATRQKHGQQSDHGEEELISSAEGNLSRAASFGGPRFLRSPSPYICHPGSAWIR